MNVLLGLEVRASFDCFHNSTVVKKLVNDTFSKTGRRYFI